MEVITWGCLMSFPNDGTLAYRILEHTAICGELPAYLLSELPYSPNYVNNVVHYLKRNKLLRTYYRDRVRGYRLTAISKQILLATNPDRFTIFLTGNVETNLVKSDLSRRKRLHNIAGCLLFMENGHVAIFQDRKPVVFESDVRKLPPMQQSAFYTSREIKNMGDDAIKISGSRMSGVLLTPCGVYITYNCCNGLLKLDYRYEQRTKTLITNSICYERFPNQYYPDQVCGLMLGKDLSVFMQIIRSADSKVRSFFLLDGSFEHFYYLTSDRFGIALLKLLTDSLKQETLEQILQQDLLAPDPEYPIQHDAFDTAGNPVLFGYFMDIPRINRFYMGLRLYGKSGTIICFDFQRDTLSCLFGSLAQIQAISFEKFERSFFSSEHENS